MYSLTLRVGKKGYYLGLVAPAILAFGALTVYFVVIVQSLYPLLLALINKAFKMNVSYVDPNQPPYFHPGSFSATWVAFFEFVKLVSIGMKRDLSIFIRMGSLGAFCVMCLIGFVIIYGFLSLSDTTYATTLDKDTGNDHGLLWQDPNSSIQELLLFNSSFSNLAGILCAGYFIHQFSIPIVKNAAEPEKNIRNVFIGYLLVFLCYITVGALGYIAFSGEAFKNYYFSQAPGSSDMGIIS